MSEKSILIRYSGYLIFAMSLLAGILTYDKYGLAWDEDAQRRIGMLNYNYVFLGDTSLNHFADKDYGAGFELPLYMLEKGLGLEDTRAIFMMRHLVSHLFFLVGAFVLFLLADFLFQNKGIAIAGYLMLLLNPQIYAHSFFNTKDIPFLTILIFCFYFAALAFSRRKLGYFLLLGIASGFLVNTRIMGILPVGCFVIFFLLDFVFMRKTGTERKMDLLNLLIFLFVSGSVLYLTWPYLYQHPIDNFATAFSNMSHFRWNAEVLLFGKLILGPEIPWYFTLTWFSIANPLVFLLIGTVGIVIFLAHIFRSPFSFFADALKRNFLLYLICFFVPVLAVILLKSVLYDGWRQLYFIYPSFILLGLFGLSRMKNIGVKWGARLLVFAGCFGSFYHMIQTFPHEHVFFNYIVNRNRPEEIRREFDMDYWGTSSRKGLEYILKNDPSPLIRIFPAIDPVVLNRMILRPDERPRIEYVYDESQADYFVTFYRWHPKDFDYPASKVFYDLKVSNSSILTVFKLKD